MSKSRAKKLRKRARQAATQDATLFGEGGGQNAWYNSKGESCDRNFLSLKLESLGPFLFGQSSLCEKAVNMAKEKHLLPPGSVMWPVFFDLSQWDQLQRIVSVICETVHLCESNNTFCGYLMSPTKASQVSFGLSIVYCYGTPLREDDHSLSKLVQLHSKHLNSYSSMDILPAFQVFRIHAMDFTSRAVASDPGSLFFAGLADKDKLIAPVKDRGNTNYKQQRFRAAIADYTTAIRLCPYSAILYCNRALCYLKNDDHWSSCLDSYRALVLKPTWEKAYYRCAESFRKLGDIDTALRINSIARSQCEQLGDLVRQYTELQQQNKSSGECVAPTAVREGADKHNSTVASDEIDGSNESTSAELKSTSKTSKKTKADPKEKQKDDRTHKNSEKSSGGNKDTSHRTTNSGKEAASASNLTAAPPKRDESFTRFEMLQYPILDSKISCQQLRKLSKLVKLKNFSPASYFAQGSAWERLEPGYVEPPKPKTDPTSSHKPMPAVFDEIWCPMRADLEDSENIIPPTFTYLDNGAAKQTLPTLVTGMVRKEVFVPGY